MTGHDTVESSAGSVAVVGMAGRFPGAPDLDAFWRNLRGGVESVAPLSDEELLAEGVPREVFSRPEYVRAASVLDGVDLFDASFFNVNAREAALLDPQQRLFLETVWHALENAGRGPGTDSDVGVFGGAGMSAYLMSNLLGGSRIVMSPTVFELQIHNDKDYLASRTAYLLGLNGPAVSVQTACSSSLVAVHQAVRALVSGDCGTAVAGGVCVRVPHKVGYLYEEGLIYSPDGHCRPFDADARGTVFGNGVGAVVLRRLEDALADGDDVLAVIRATAVNNDGNDKVGYTAPSVAGQQRLIASALAASQVEAHTITAMEAHGTGTQVGDPIEISALSRAFGEHTTKTGFCALGSVKANIGHLESAAGVASLIKAVLQLRHRELVGDPHFRSPNPRIDFGQTPFFVNTELSEWRNGTHPRRIGVSSFGIGGTNAHAILEEAPARRPSPEPVRRPQVVLLSAKSPQALDQATADLADHLDAERDTADAARLADVASTTRLGRGSLRFRRALVADEVGTAVDLLRGSDPSRVASAVARPAAPKVVFLFPGQGTQHPGMGRGLYEAEPVFRAAVDECAEILLPLLDLDVRTALYEAEEGDEAAATAVEQTGLAQPALFVTEYALARQLLSWGVTPDAMVGHSLGEFVAACLAGVMDLGDALRLVASRGRLMQDLPGGDMLSVGLPEEELRELLPAELSVAAVNGPALCVVSGPSEAVAEFRESLEGREVSTRLLRTSHAFHSAMVDPVVPTFTDQVREVSLRAPELPIRSTVTGGWLEAEGATDHGYWGTHMREPVRFGQAVREAVADLGQCVLVEVGPGNTLGTLARQAVDSAATVSVVSGMRRADQDGPDVEVLLSALAGLWLAGVEVDWTRSEPGRARVALPGYPFQRQRYWVEPRGGGASGELVIDTPTGGEDAEGEATAGGRPAHLLTTYVAPRDDAERTLVELWEEFFGFSPIGVHDNFFELGGHSLLATQILNRLGSRLGHSVAPSQLLSRPSVAGLAELLAEQEDSDAPALKLPVLVPDPERRHQPFPLNEMQQAQWIGRLGSFDMGGVAPHLYLEFDSDTLDAARLQRAWQQVVRRHEMLRIVVLADGRQRILDNVPDYEFEELDLRGVDPEEARALLAEVSDRMSTEVRPADTWPLWEVRVSRLGDGRLRTHISFDLLCADVASFFYQILPSWREFHENPELPSEPPELSFRDYVLAEEALHDSPLYERSLEYWRERVAQLPPAPELPTVVAPGELVTPEFVRRHGSLDPRVWAGIKERAGEHGVTPSSVLLAAYAAAVGRWSKSQHFTLNFTAVNRLPFHPDVDTTVGEFASFELLEVDVRELDTFAELVTQVQRRSWEDFEHRYVSGVRILRELNRLRRDTTGGLMPIVFTSALSTETDPASVPSPLDWLGEQAGFISQTPQVTIDHFVLELGGRLELAWHAVDELFPDGMMAEMFEAYQELLVSLATREGWDRPPLVALPEEQLRARVRANDTSGPVPEGLLADRVLAAGRDPVTAGRPAVVAGDRVLTHAELAARAGDLAGRLVEAGHGRGSVVGVGLSKGWRQVVAAVGASAAGCTYVPVDPELPESRRRWLVEHAGVQCLLVDGAGGTEWPEGVPTLVVPDGSTAPPAEAADWRCLGDPGDIAYVIYTSGSTGTPKGVAVTHTAALNTLVDVQERVGLTETDAVLGLSSLSFDLSVFDVFGILGAGAALVLPEPEARRDPARWVDLLREHHVTVWNSVPALFEMLVTYLENGREEDTGVALRLAMLSGDWIPVSLPDRARAQARDLRVVSLGGATEAAIWSIHFPVEEVPREWTSIPYGYPLRNQSFHVLNDRMEPAPVWTAGHLHIGGVGLASCYWNDEQRTAESFVTHPTTGERLYRTGDLGRYLPGGVIEFLGREDFQVKIGGFRVELGEVEHAIERHPKVANAVAAALGSRTQQRLVAYVVPAEPAEDLIESVREHLAGTVPNYLVPADIVVLDELPLSANGKVDRAALPAPDRVGHAGGGDGIVDERLADTLERLLALAAESLSVEAAGAEDNFFSLGGDSIMGIQFVSRAAAEGLQVGPQDLFESDTFLDLARRVTATSEQEADGTVAPFTPHQAALVAEGAVDWITVEAAASDLDPALAERALREIADRHPALRLRSGTRDDGTPGQYDGGSPGDGLFSEIDLSGLAEDARDDALAEIVAEMSEEVGLAEREPVKLAVVRAGADDVRLLWLAAGAALDDTSWRLLLAEFGRAYQQLAERGSIDWTGMPESVLGWVATQEGAAPPPSVETVAFTGELRTVLDADVTTAFAEATFGAYHLELGEAVAAALTVAARAWPGREPAVTVERSLRTATTDEALGRFTEVTTLDVAAEAVADTLTGVKRAYRDVVRPAPAHPRVHLRDVRSGDWRPTAGPLSPAGLSSPVSTATTPEVLAEVGAAVVGGELVLRWRHTTDAAEATALAEAFTEAVETITEHCRQAGSGSYEPSDFPLAGVDPDELSALLSTLEK
ncbi:hybrid non-ribosomal peptide synthetase/type I polyketide synthase [Actinoalloteichus caeruleus]|uniref:Phenyloxazoline synthase MbtB n=3 Tax=Actinoalloteichus cyanogriseus TaxID=2893586 RepID=M1F4W8_ACTCY|nr:hybrid non-ribosomal peptide synthetase/type I polyketide synthase [Actinoalloteichus caeruleus]AFK24516.1 PKS/NrpS [Actinoalloteichus caeruleus]